MRLGATSVTPTTPLRVLLIGAGHFGRHHLQEWQGLQKRGLAELVGVVVGTLASRDALASQYQVPVHIEIDDAILASVDAVDIASPSHSHAELVRRCLPHAHVLVEKPICATSAEATKLFRLAKRHKHVLVAGHVYRHHPLAQALRAVVAKQGPANAVSIVLTNPITEARPDLDPFEEFLHVFDLLQLLWPQPTRVVSAWQDGTLAEVSIALADSTKAVLRMGWAGTERVRRINVAYPDLRLGADFLDGQLIHTRRGRIEKQNFGTTPVALGRQLEAFVGTVRGHGEMCPAASDVIAVQKLMNQAQQSAVKTDGVREQSLDIRDTRRNATRPRVAIIGGGIFGVSCALELADQCNIVLLERHEQLLTEASYFNQWRHHSGFHYPRSIETIQEVQASKAEFEAAYGEAVRRDVTAYYAVSNMGNEISRDRYLAVCRSNGLKFEESMPPAGVLRSDRVSVCLRTDESVIDINHLTQILRTRLQSEKHVDLRLGSELIGGRLLADGRKRLKLQGPAGKDNLEVDFVVNATYANTNLLAGLFGFPVRPMRFDLLEMAVLHIPGAERFMMTILDAPFTSLTTLGERDLFLLSHIKHSILASEVTPDGMPPLHPPRPFNHPNLLAAGLRYLPILEKARYVESRLGLRTVGAFNEDFDGRPTVVTSHGFGCWSVLGGKIITAVSNAREIAEAIGRESGLNPRIRVAS